MCRALQAMAGVLWMAGLAACSGSVEARHEGASSAGGGGNSGAAQTGTGGGTGSGPTTCTQLYVGPYGDDTRSGCTHEDALRTIGAAVAKAKSAGAATVSACAGVYDEPVSIDGPVTLLGGFDCKSWERSPGYGYPTFDRVHETTVGGSQLPEALHVHGTAVNAVTIDGFTFIGARAGENGRAVRIDGGAAPVFTNNRVLGGATASATAYGSVGLWVDDGAEPDIHSCSIDGGSGFARAPGAIGRVGVVVQSARPRLHDSVVTGGTAAPPSSEGIGSVGVLLRDADLTEQAGRPLAGLSIAGGDGDSTLDQAGLSSIGLRIEDGTDVDVVACAIEPGRVSGGTALGLRGIDSQTTGTVRIRQSRIYGGDLSSWDDPGGGWRVAALVDGAQALSVENSMLHGGVADVPEFDQGSPSFALAIYGVEAPIIRHNTLYSGPSGFPTVGTALFLDGVRGARVENNILAAAVGWNEPIWTIDCASKGVFATLRSNLLFNTGDTGDGQLGSLFGYGASPGGTCGAWQGFSTIDEVSSHLGEQCHASTPGDCSGFGGTDVAGNLTLDSDCGDDSGCIGWPACSASEPCIDSILETWDADDGGLSALRGGGWKLSSAIPCAIARSALDLTAEVSLDHFGAPRTAAPSLGAHELDGSCIE